MQKKVKGGEKGGNGRKRGGKVGKGGKRRKEKKREKGQMGISTARWGLVRPDGD